MDEFIQSISEVKGKEDFSPSCHIHNFTHQYIGRRNGINHFKVFKELFYDEDNLEHTMYMQLCSFIEKKKFVLLSRYEKHLLRNDRISVVR